MHTVTCSEHGLIGAVRAAIASYDRGRDHARHDRGGDCVRCRLAEVVGHGDDPRFPNDVPTVRLSLRPEVAP